MVENWKQQDGQGGPIMGFNQIYGKLGFVREQRLRWLGNLLKMDKEGVPLKTQNRKIDGRKRLFSLSRKKMWQKKTRQQK